MRIDIECSACNGTGLYVGMCERDGSAVICSTCRGTGCVQFTYATFYSRNSRLDVERVYKSSQGFCISAKDVTSDKGRLLPFSQAGVSYSEWLNGKEPEHMDFLGCPMQADQSACHKVEGFTERCDTLGLGFGGSISKCPKHDDCVECWKLFKEGK